MTMISTTQTLSITPINGIVTHPHIWMLKEKANPKSLRTKNVWLWKMHVFEISPHKNKKWMSYKWNITKINQLTICINLIQSNCRTMKGIIYIILSITKGFQLCCISTRFVPIVGGIKTSWPILIYTHKW